MLRTIKANDVARPFFLYLLILTLSLLVSSACSFEEGLRRCSRGSREARVSERPESGTERRPKRWIWRHRAQSWYRRKTKGARGRYGTG